MNTQYEASPDNIKIFLFVLFCSYIIVLTAPRQLQFSSPVQEQREGDGEERFRQHTRPIQREEGRKGTERQEKSKYLTTLHFLKCFFGKDILGQQMFFSFYIPLVSQFSY